MVFEVSNGHIPYFWEEKRLDWHSNRTNSNTNRFTISDFWPKLVVSLLGFCGGIAGGHPATRGELSENGFKDVNSEILSGECDQGEVLPPHYVDLSLC